MICPKCGSNNVNVQLVSENKKTGCLGIIIKLLLLWYSIIVWLISLIIPKRKKTNKYAVCQSCGNSWRL